MSTAPLEQGFAPDALARIVASDRVRDGSALGRDVSDKAQVCVIGTGAGGATVAHELARRGHSVVLIEEGQYLTGRDFTGVPHEMVEKLYRNRGITGTVGRLMIPIPLGRCVGGTTTINSGTCYRAPASVLDAWQDEHGISGVQASDLEPYYQRVERDLGVAAVPDATYGQNSLLFERGAEALGYAGARIPRNARGCLGTGVCAFGCPQDAKQAMHVSYVPAALAAGAVLYTRARAERLLLENGRVFGVVANLLDGRERPTGKQLRVVADRVVVACGALLTPAFLERNGVGGTSGTLGRNLHIHPAARIGALFRDEVRGWAEVPQAYNVHQFTEEGVFIQGQFVPPSFAAPELPGIGMTHKSIMADYPYLGSFGALISDTSAGRVRAGRSSFPIVHYTMNDTDRRRMLRAIRLTSEIFFAAGALEVYSAVRSRPMLRSMDEAIALEGSPVTPSDIELMAFHPMGTARMADDPKRGVTGAFGQVHDTRDLYVADASLFPASCKVNPQMTIMALATRIGEHLASGLGAPF